jgi:hypothetical protein
MRPIMSSCDDCGKVTEARLLDAVLLKDDESEASSQAYCKDCWPKHKRVAHDEWRPMWGEDK